VGLRVKLSRHKQLVLIFQLVSLLMIVGCEIDTRIAVSEENPPKITFSGSGGIYRLFIWGPYTKEEINLPLSGKGVMTTQEGKEIEKAISGDRKLWELAPVNVKTNLPNIPAITYGIVSKEFKQIYPKNDEKPATLMEGSYYQASAPSYSANDRVTTFLIQGNKAIKISVER
jgi:hypothetical protein